MDQIWKRIVDLYYLIIKNACIPRPPNWRSADGEDSPCPPGFTPVFIDGIASTDCSQVKLSITVVGPQVTCISMLAEMNDDLLTKYQHIEAETKRQAFCSRHFQIHFLEWSWFQHVSSGTEICFKGFNQWGAGFGFDKHGFTQHVTDKPLYQTIMAHFTDAYMRHLASMT